MRDAERRGGSTLACREAVELLTAYVEDALPPGRAARVAHHLRDCSDCRVYLEQLRLTVTALAAAPLPRLPAQACADIVAAFERRAPTTASDR
jgi:anti-sigma factor RsiW